MKGKDKLEEFIIQNKAEFDELEPQNELWNNIAQRLDNHTQVVKNYNWIWKAAAVVFLCLSIGLIWERNANNTNGNIAENEVLVSESPEDIELLKVENYYTNLINERKTEINIYASTNPSLAKTFENDLVQLDSIYGQLKTQILQNNNDQKVKDAMILNLQLRIEILNRQLNILQQIKQIKKDENYSI